MGWETILQVYQLSGTVSVRRWYFSAALEELDVQQLGTVCRAQEEARVHGSQGRCDQGTGWTQQGKHWLSIM